MLLALDTAFSACSVALASKSGKLVADRHVLQNRGQAETLVPMVAEVLKEAGATPGDITRIIVTRGPGTFAGVRVGVAFARTFALATGAPVLGLTSFEALAASLSFEGAWSKEIPLVVALPAGREGVSVEMFSPDKSPLPQTLKGPETVSPEDFYSWVGSKEGLIAGPRLENFPEAPEFTVMETWLKATDLIRCSMLYGQDADQKTATPLYLRPPDATPQKPSPLFVGP